MVVLSNPEIEAAYLGSLILGADNTDQVTHAMFADPRNAIIFSTIRRQQGEGVKPSLVTIAHELSEERLLDKAGGPAYIAELTNTVATTANAAYYAGELKVAYIERTAQRAVAAASDAIREGKPSASWVPELVRAIEGREAPGADTGISFRDLMQVNFPAETFLVEGLLTSGLTVLTGASKIGKSWAALQLVQALDGGGCYLGTLRAQKCDVLYCALEDTPKRVQRRIQKQGGASFNGSRLETKRRTPAALKAYLKTHPNFRVVIVDTLQKMLGIHDLNDYSQTVDGLSALKDIADSLSIAVMVIHHNRKGSNDDGDHMESALGSTGINATADTTLTMRRKRGTSEATLSVTGRDVEDTAFTLAWDGSICSWAVTDRGALQPASSPERQAVINLLDSDRRVWTTGEIAEAIGKSAPTTSHLLSRLMEDRQILRPGYGKWASVKFVGLSPSKGNTNLQSSETEEAVA